jgi:asparagine synthase (glutamine-hydrolysing)
MSGIAGIIHFDGAPVAPGLIESMTRAMSYRGPDGINHWVKGSVALGQCMLRTTPESLEETQPLTNEDETLVLVMDGRVDNWEELRRELLLHDAVLRTRADAELVLRAYELWGRECVAHVDGDFALVIWDARRREAFCARDRIGNRPIYFWRHRDSLAIASDFHAILKLTQVPREINEYMIAEHIAVRVDNLRDTLLAGISRLPPAHVMVLGKDRAEEHRYWDVDCYARSHCRSDAEYAERFLDLFRETIRRQMRSTGPIGVYLSGGVDSSSVSCVAAALAPGPAVDSFSLVFPGRDFDERPFIDVANRACGFRGNCISGGPSPLSHYIQQISRYMDVCDGPNEVMLNALRSAARDSGIRVMMTGYGGDEWFGQSRNYYFHILQSMNLGSLIRQFRFDVGSGKSVPRLFDALLYRGFYPLIPERMRRPLGHVRRWASRRTNASKAIDRGIFRPEFAARLASLDRMDTPDRCTPGTDSFHRRIHGLLPLGWNVRGSEIDSRGIAEHGLEERNPFYDRRIIEFAFSLPEDQRSRNAGKHVIREAMRGILPTPIRERHNKAEFSEVVADTMIGSDMSRWLRCDRLSARGWVDGVEVQRRYGEFRRLYSEGSNAYIQYVWELWMVFVVEAWVEALGESSA